MYGLGLIPRHSGLRVATATPWLPQPQHYNPMTSLLAPERRMKYNALIHITDEWQ